MSGWHRTAGCLPPVSGGRPWTAAVLSTADLDWRSAGRGCGVGVRCLAAEHWPWLLLLVGPTVVDLGERGSVETGRNEPSLLDEFENGIGIGPPVDEIEHSLLDHVLAERCRVTDGSAMLGGLVGRSAFGRQAVDVAILHQLQQLPADLV